MIYDIENNGIGVGMTMDDPRVTTASTLGKQFHSGIPTYFYGGLELGAGQKFDFGSSMFEAVLYYNGATPHMSNKPRYCKIGDHVYMTGKISFRANENEPLDIMFLPVPIRPEREISWIAATEDKYTFASLSVNKGVLTCNWVCDNVNALSKLITVDVTFDWIVPYDNPPLTDVSNSSTPMYQLFTDGSVAGVSWVNKGLAQAQGTYSGSSVGNNFLHFAIGVLPGSSPSSATQGCYLITYDKIDIPEDATTLTIDYNGENNLSVSQVLSLQAGLIDVNTTSINNFEAVVSDSVISDTTPKSLTLDVSSYAGSSDYRVAVYVYGTMIQTVDVFKTVNVTNIRFDK